MPSFLLVDKGSLFFTRIRNSRDFHHWPVLKRNQAAKFLKNFQVHCAVYSQENYVFKWKLYVLIYFAIGLSALIFAMCSADVTCVN